MRLIIHVSTTCVQTVLVSRTIKIIKRDENKLLVDENGNVLNYIFLRDLIFSA